MKQILRQLLRHRLGYKGHYSSTKLSGMMTTSLAKYEYVEDVEDMSSYSVGGFHPVKIGDKCQKRYRIVHKLGYGACATFWLAKDLRLMKYVALKIGIADWKTDEAEILTTLTGEKSKFSELFPTLLDQFAFIGPNGKHKCLVLEAARCSLAASKEVSWIRLFHLKTARILSAQITIAINEIHRKGYIHNGKLTMFFRDKSY